MTIIDLYSIVSFSFYHSFVNLVKFEGNLTDGKGYTEFVKTDTDIKLEFYEIHSELMRLVGCVRHVLLCLTDVIISYRGLLSIYPQCVYFMNV